MTEKELGTLAKKQFPGGEIQEIAGSFVFMTVHGTGNTREEALENSLSEFARMKEDGQNLQRILDDVLTDLAEQRGMSRERHDSLQELLTIAEQALNDGVLTGVIPWIMIPSYNRQIEELRRRITTRLNMVAQDMKEREQAKIRAAEKPQSVVDDGLTSYQRLIRKLK